MNVFPFSVHSVPSLKLTLKGGEKLVIGISKRNICSDRALHARLTEEIERQVPMLPGHSAREGAGSFYSRESVACPS